MNNFIKPIISAFSLVALAGCNKQDEPQLLPSTPIYSFNAAVAPRVELALAQLKDPLPQTLDGCMALALNYSSSRALLQATMMHKAMSEAAVDMEAGPKAALRRWNYDDYREISARFDAAAAACNPLMRQVNPDVMSARPEMAETYIVRDHLFATASRYGQLLQTHAQRKGKLDKSFCLEARLYALGVNNSLKHAAFGDGQKFGIYDQQVHQLQQGVTAVCN